MDVNESANQFIGVNPVSSHDLSRPVLSVGSASNQFVHLACTCVCGRFGVRSQLIPPAGWQTPPESKRHRTNPDFSAREKEKPTKDLLADRVDDGRRKALTDGGSSHVV